MAKSRASKPEKTVPITTATAVLDEPEPPEPPESDDMPVQEAAEPPKREPPKVPSFFQTMGRVQKEDWGPRASIYLYRLEPMIDRLRGGDKKYIMMYTEPLTEERIMVDHGSGRYKAVLNIRKAGAERGDEIDSHFFDIMNLKYPPKVPKGEWVDDPRNKKWAWAKEPDVPPAPPASGLAEFTGVFRAASELRKEIREEMQPAQPVQPAQPAPVDPWAAAEKILQMRSDNPMVTILMTRMDAMDKAAEASRLREAELQKELRDQMRIQPQAQPAAAPKTLLEQATEFAEAATKLKSIFNTPGEVGGEAAKVVRAARMGALEFLAEVVPRIVDAPIMTAVAARLMAGAPPTDGITGAPALQPQPQPTQPNPQADLEMFLRHTITPALVQAIADKETGANFAQWLWDFLPQRLTQLQNFTHPRLPGLSGPAAIIMAYKHSPVWPSLSIHGEEAFALFVQEFCAWKSPDQEQEPEIPASGPTPFNEPTDSDQETQERV